MMEARKQCIFKVLKENNCQRILLYLANTFFKNKGELKALSHRQKLREFIASLPLQSSTQGKSSQTEKQKMQEGIQRRNKRILNAQKHQQ